MRGDAGGEPSSGEDSVMTARGAPAPLKAAADLSEIKTGIRGLCKARVPRLGARRVSHKSGSAQGCANQQVSQKLRHDALHHEGKRLMPCWLG
jgi:hypothetical protein